MTELIKLLLLFVLLPFVIVILIEAIKSFINWHKIKRLQKIHHSIDIVYAKIIDNSTTVDERLFLVKKMHGLIQKRRELIRCPTYSK